MSIVLDKIKKFENKTGQNINDYLMSTISEYTVQKGISSISDFCKNYWNEYQEEYLKDLGVNFSTLDPNELTDIVSSFVIYPYSYSNYQSPEVKLQILKQPSAELILENDNNFVTPELAEKICDAIQNGEPIDSFSQEIISNKDVAKTLCEMNGKYLEKLPSWIVTEELVTIALSHTESGKKPTFEALSAPGLTFHSNKGIMEKLCAYDGRFLECASADIVDPSLIKISMHNEEESKQFKLERVGMATGVRSNVRCMEYLCSIDGNLLKYAKDEIITESLVNVALSNSDPTKRYDIRNLSNDATLCRNKSAMRCFCRADGRLLQYTNPDILDEELIVIATSRDDEHKSFKFKEGSELILNPTMSGLTKDEEVMRKFCSVDGGFLKYANSDVITKQLIDIAMSHSEPNKNFEINQLEDMIRRTADKEFIQSSLFDSVLEKLSEIHNFDFDMAKYYFSSSLDLNDEVLLTLNFEILQDKYQPLYEDSANIYTIDKRFQKLFVLGVYPDVQRDIIQIGNPINPIDGSIDTTLGIKRLELLNSMLKKAVPIAEQGEKTDWVPYYANVITGFNSNLPLYDRLIQDGPLSNKELTDLTNYVLGKHEFKIDSLEDLRNYEVIKSRYIEEGLSNPNSEEHFRNAILEKHFGISLTQARELFVPYAKGVLQEPDSFPEDIVEFFKGISTIMNEKDIFSFNQSSLSSEHQLNEQQIVTMGSNIKKSLVKMYNDSLFKVEGKTPSDTLGNIKVYKAAGENGDQSFNLSLSSIGAYNSQFDPFQEGYNYSNDWNKPKISNHGICTTFCGNNYLGTALIKHSVVAFTDYDDYAMLLAGTKDLGSNSTNCSFDHSKAVLTCNYFTPKGFIDNTRHPHNEVVYERREGDGKRQPAYVVFFCDEYDQIKKKYEEALEKGVNINTKERDKYREKIEPISDREWETLCIFNDTIRSAEDFGDIPMVVVEYKKIAKNEHKKIFADEEDYNGHLARFRDETELSRENVQRYFHDIVVEFENNLAGYKEQRPDIVKEFFNDQHVEQITTVIRNKIKGTKDPNIVSILLDELEAVVVDEETKGLGISRKLPNDLRATLNGLREEYGYTSEESREISNVNTESIANAPRYISNFLTGQIADNAYLNEYNDSLNFPNQYSVSQVTSMIDESLKSKIEETISDMYKDNLYAEREMSAHSSKHAEDVILFAGLVGKMTGLSTHDIDLLMEAAKFHDAGRINDANAPHSITSATLAKEKLSDKYNSEDLGIICAAIAYHEMSDILDNEGRIDYKNLDTLCKNYGLDKNNNELMDRTRKVADCLKDADALDRTRFLAGTKSFTDPYFLRNDVSKSLIKVSCQLNESYAVEELQVIRESSSDEVKDMIDNSLLSTNSPKATIREYRKGYLNSNNYNLDNYSMEEGFSSKK